MSIISFCKKSLQQLSYIANQSQKKYILIGVKGGGCNGLKYFIEPTDEEPLKIDEHITLHVKDAEKQAEDVDGVVDGAVDGVVDGDDVVDVIVCGKSLFYLIGTKIEWKTDYMGSRFEFNNPNANSSCGCGETFSV